MNKPWDRFLTEQDRNHLAMSSRAPVGFGESPALLMVDNYRWVVGDEPQPLLDAVKTWPGSIGLPAWDALEHIRVLLAAARKAAIPVVHVTGLAPSESGVTGWHGRIHAARRAHLSPDEQARLQRKYEIVEQAAPVAGEAVLKKAAPSAFFGTPLVSHLVAMGIDTLIVGGESTSGCVRATVVDAASWSYRVIIPQECVYDRHEAAHAMNLFDMHHKYADVLPVDDVLAWIRAREGQEAAGGSTAAT